MRVKINAFHTQAQEPAMCHYLIYSMKNRDPDCKIININGPQYKGYICYGTEIKI